MKAVLIAATVLFHCLGQRCILGQEPLCQSHSSCSECIRSPSCAWCTQTVSYIMQMNEFESDAAAKNKTKQQFSMIRKGDFLKPGESNERRCDSVESLKNRKCKADHVINPVKHPLTNVKNSDLSDDVHNVVQLKPQNVNITLRVGVPFEFTVEFKRAQGYPIDLYYLMDLSYSMKDDLEQIKTLGQKILKKLKDITQTVRIGFGSFVDKEMLPYVSQVKARRQNPCPNRIDTCQPAFISKQKISGNLDAPEAGLDAIMQAAVCKDKIKWGNVTRILVYTSDDTFHMAGDGRLGGVFQPHNGQCLLNVNGSYNGKAYDYPSVGHVSRVLQDNNIQLIFAVTEDIYPAYKALSALIPQSVVGVLKNDSSNVVDLISEAYGGNKADIEWKEKGECQGIKHEKIAFKVRLNASECLKEPQTFRIKMQGINEEVKITVHTECHCDCGASEKAATYCSGKGTLSCGLCSCDDRFLGQQCQCAQQSDKDSIASMLASCRLDNSSRVCSGHGTCVCGKCECRGKLKGKFCECDDNNCERHNSILCNGKGECQCGKCNCTENYTGSACECSPSQDNCTNDKGLCSGQGKCTCNHCQCNEGFTGNHCSEFINACTKMKDCVACHVQTPDIEGCAVRCFNAKVIRLEGYHELHCTYADTTSYDLYDIREYQNFVRAQKMTEWKEVQNPLFKGATTTVYNPLHDIEDKEKEHSELD
ncbi:Integrin beta-7 [Labeo rohita]|uniref:Integrin beta n=1 Tax=Labeo rohita TaxID=84645 RepID=A0ABQ8MLI3_LABRO|nr:Integrin beta-7 [Labeo rohita]